MARPAKPSVRYCLPNERAIDGYTKLRGIASFNRKRLSFPITLEPWEISYPFTCINTDGSFTPCPAALGIGTEEEEDAKQLSQYLCSFRDAVLAIIEKAIKRGVWERMTSADLNALISFIAWDGKETNIKEILKRGGVFDTWAKKTV